MSNIINTVDWGTFNPNQPLAIACDGSSLGNPGASGYGWYHSHQLYGWGGSKRSTNNAMELSALGSALRVIPSDYSLNLILDSKYVIDSFTKYIYAWERNGYITSKGGPVANKDLIMEIWGLLKPRLKNTEFTWVKGHDGHPLNTQADKLATSAARRFV